MKTLSSFAALLSIYLLAATASAGDFPKKVHYIDHEKTTTAMYKGGRVIEDAGLIVIANRAVQRGAELHKKTNHVFIIMDGEAEFITGGTLIEPRETRRGKYAPRTSKAAYRIDW